MAKIKEILGKLFSQKTSEPGTLPQKLTPEEMELSIFKERERLDNVKKELFQFRRKNAMLKQESLEKKYGEPKRSIISNENIFKEEKREGKSLLNSGNLFVK